MTNFNFPTFCLGSDRQCKVLHRKSLVFTENRLLPTEVRNEALQLQKLLEYDDGGAEGYFWKKNLQH